MDPVTQGVFGSLWAQTAARRERLRVAAGAGFAGGLAADLDVLIRSPIDSLLAIEYHRHFTHSLIFIPFGGLAVALILWPLFRRWTRFGPLYLWTTLGFASHGLLDAFTSYGTYLLWPFSDQRVAWNYISVIDPLFTVPIALILAMALWQRRRTPVFLAGAWAAMYLTAGGIQQHRAEQVLARWADDQGLSVERLVAKPAFGNLVLWRGLVDDGQRFHVAAIRNLPRTRPLVYPGGAMERFSGIVINPGSRLGRDLRRFEHFSAGWLVRYPPYEDRDTWFVADFRYAIDPASTRPLWGVRFDPTDQDRPAEYETPRRVTGEERQRFLARLRGRDVD